MGEKYINELNNIYGNWKVLSLSETIGHSRERYWYCECQDCKNVIEISGRDLRANKLPSCKKCYVLKDYNIEKVSEEELKNIKEIFPPYSGKLGGRFVDRSGTKVGHLKLLYRGENDPSATRPRVQYVCKCDCGNIVKQRGENILQSGNSASCGRCKEFQFNQLTELKNFYILNSFQSDTDNNIWHTTIQCKQCEAIFSPRRHELYNNFDYKCPKCNAGKNFKIGDFIGELQIITKKVDEENHLKFLCKCSCGEELWINGFELNSRRTCGKHNNPADIVGKKFGKLLVINFTDEFHGGQRMYLCRCDCGTEKLIGRSNLISGHTSSCGCINSKGEEQVGQILTNYNIKFEKAKTFEDFYRNNKCGKLKFDFYLPDYNCAIEFDGIQHFKNTHKFVGWYTEESQALTHERDLFKDDYCFKKGIILIRIPYYALDDIIIDDLLPSSSSFILTPQNQKEYYDCVS